MDYHGPLNHWIYCSLTLFLAEWDLTVLIAFSNKHVFSTDYYGNLWKRSITKSFHTKPLLNITKSPKFFTNPYFHVNKSLPTKARCFEVHYGQVWRQQPNIVFAGCVWPKMMCESLFSDINGHYFVLFFNPGEPSVTLTYFTLTPDVFYSSMEKVLGPSSGKHQ